VRYLCFLLGCIVNTDGSVFAALLCHMMFNLSDYVFPTLGSDGVSLFLFGLLVVAVRLSKAS